MKKITVVTHSGSYHADDLFAAATLSLFFESEGKEIEITRTRDAAIIQKAEYVIDVGGIYDEKLHRFDHHQSGGAGIRANGIPYAAFGLVWKFFGEKLCGSKKIADEIDEKLVSPLDAHDNGFDITDSKIPNINPYTVQDFFYAFRPTWKEDTSMDAVFMELIELAKAILAREIKRAIDAEEAVDFVEKAYREAEDKRLIVLDGFWPWKDVIQEHSEPLYVVFEDRDEKRWCARAVTVKGESFKNRKDFPATWAGKRDAELASITGVSDAVFCHNKLFIAFTASKEGAIWLAKLALDA